MKNLSITYDNFTQVPSGSYTSTFVYPGLSYQASKEDITHDNGRIRLGKIIMTKEITVE